MITPISLKLEIEYVPNFVQIETVCLDWPVKENYQTSSSRAQKRN